VEGFIPLALVNLVLVIGGEGLNWSLWWLLPASIAALVATAFCRYACDQPRVSLRN